MFGLKQKQAMPAPELALPGRATPLAIMDRHFVLGTPLLPPFPAGSELALFGLLLGRRAEVLELARRALD